jgi:hypothetical protein
MSTLPGAPTGVEDILTEILAELRSINAKLGQSTTVQTTVDWPGLMNSDEVLAILDEMTHPGRGVIV